jgi:hypothetical protein
MEINLINESELHNVVSGPEGLQTRPGLKTILRVEDLGVVTPRTAAGTQTAIVSGFSCESANTGEVFHYLFSVDAVNECTGWVYSDEMECLGSYTIGQLASRTPFSVAINYNQIVVNSPGLPFPLWGFIGGTLVRARAVDSINPDTPDLTLFPGRVCGFADRFVWAYANQIIINDPGTEPRTICGQNTASFGGTVLDLFQAGEGGALVVVCTDATYQIPPDALAGYQIQGSIVRLPGYQGTYPNNAATVRGTTAGLCKDGLISLGTFQRRDLTNYRRRRSLAAPVGPGTAGDYRLGAIFPAESCFYVAIGGRVCQIDLDSSLTSWIYPSADSTGNAYTGGSTFNVVGVLKNSEGTDILLTDVGVVALWGSVDIGLTPTSAVPTPLESIPVGYVCKNIETSPKMSPVLREITIGGDRAGVRMQSQCRGSTGTATVPAPQGSRVVGTDVWSVSALLVEREYRSRRMQRSVRGDAPDVELAWSGGGTRIAPIANIEFSGWGKTRPTN